MADVKRRFVLEFVTAKSGKAKKDLDRIKTSSKRADEQFKKLKADTKKTGQSMERMGGDTRRAGRSLGEISTKSGRAANDLRRLESQGRRTGRALDQSLGAKGGGGGGGGSGFIGKLQTILLAIPVVGKLLGSLTGIAKKMGDNFLSVEDAIARAVGSLGVAKSGINDFEKALLGSDKAAKKLGISQELLAVARKEKFTPGEFARQQLGAIVGQASLEAKFGDTKLLANAADGIIKDFGLSLATAADAAKAQNVFRVVAELAKVENIDLATASSAVSGIVGASGTGPGRRTAREAANVLLVTAAEGRTSVGETGARSEVFLSLRAAGVSIENTAALIAALTASGARRGITALRTLETQRLQIQEQFGFRSTDIIDFLTKLNAERQRTGAEGSSALAVLDDRIKKIIDARGLAFVKAAPEIAAALVTVKKRLAGDELAFRSRVLAPTLSEQRRENMALQEQRVPIARLSTGGKVAAAMVGLEKAMTSLEAAITGDNFLLLATTDRGRLAREVTPFKSDFQDDFLGSMSDALGGALDPLLKSLNLGNTREIIESAKEKIESLTGATDTLVQVGKGVSDAGDAVAGALFAAFGDKSVEVVEVLTPKVAE